jgi:nucleoside 2-deoxyribosyltransferase
LNNSNEVDKLTIREDDMNSKECKICGQNAEYQLQSGTAIYKYSCKNCGSYRITDKMVRSNIPFPKLYLISGYIREMNENGYKDILITPDNINNYYDSPLIPQTIAEKIDKLILYLGKKTEYLHQSIAVDRWHEMSICYAANSEELNEIIKVLTDEGILYVPSELSDTSLSLTFKGIQQANHLLKDHNPSNKVFVAMWFDDKMQSAYDDAIRPAIEESGEFTPVRVDNIQHNNDITDEIIAGIKESRFIVADLSGNRGGVYYEAGFAKGLDKPVVFTCRRDWFDGSEGGDGNAKEKVHFDVNHQNIIVWESNEELRKMLVDRIRATIL